LSLIIPGTDGNRIHDGAIYAEGKLNEGATFNVFIPAVGN